MEKYVQRVADWAGSKIDLLSEKKLLWLKCDQRSEAATAQKWWFSVLCNGILYNKKKPESDCCVIKLEEEEKIDDGSQKKY